MQYKNRELDREGRKLQMPFEIQIADILDFSGDAIINPIDKISGTTGLDVQIHRPTRFRYWLETQKIKHLANGKAVITQGGELKCRYVIHTAAPRWTGDTREVAQLRGCYRSSLALAGKHGLKTIALPLFGSGTCGFPKELVLQIATEEIRAFLTIYEDTYILLAVYDKESFQPNSALLSSLEAYIRNARSSEQQVKRRNAMLDQASTGAFPAIHWNMHPISVEEASGDKEVASVRPDMHPCSYDGAYEDEENLDNTEEARDWARFIPDRGAILDESFSEMVMRKIGERGYKKDSECYSKANIDRKLFSRIRCDKQYHPKKTTALALAVALELTLSETKELLMKAGYSLSHSIESDLIVEYCIRQHIYNIFEINELLFQYDQALLGG